MSALCPMRSEGWTSREAEVRLAEHSDLRRSLGLQRVPDHTPTLSLRAPSHGEVLDEELITVA
jgi:hypothetical protein